MHKNDIISQLQRDILPLQGFKQPTGTPVRIGLGAVEDAFPNGCFPIGAIHEFIGTQPEHAAVSVGFMAGLLANLMKSGGVCVWVSTSRALFPPGLKTFGANPEHVIFIDLQKEKDLLWAMEEALKCEGLAAVVGEIQDMGFTASRRLQLAVEQSRVTGFLLRFGHRKPTANACVARWRITSLPSIQEDGLPGVGFPRWNVELLKIRNGKPGSWQVQWSAGCFQVIQEEKETIWLNASSQYGSAI